MAEGLNKVLLIGNVGRTPELRTTTSGLPVLNFSVATNERYKNRDGEWQDRTEWHSIVIWGKRGESLSRFLKKGSYVFIEGRLQTRQWEDRDGNKRYTTEIVASDLRFLGGRGGSDRAGEPGGHYGGNEPPAGYDDGGFAGGTFAEPSSPAGVDDGAMDDDDVPF